MGQKAGYNARKWTKHGRLPWNDRLRIESFLKCGKSVQEIADEIGVHRNTIYNEIKRGQTVQRTSDLIDREVYCADTAERKYRINLSAKGPALKIGADWRLADHIEQRIVEQGYSPAAVLGEIKEQGLHFETSICEATLYSYIKKGIFLTLESSNLPNGGKKKRRYKRVRKVAARPAAGTSIEDRPVEIEDRDEVGHWEMDCVVGKKSTKKTLLVLTERKSRKEIIVLMKDHTAESVVAALDRLERRYGSMFSEIFQTITVDNGSEFADCAGMEKSCRRNGNRTKVYYCHPYSSYERGTNENLNKMIRRWFPKGTDFRKVTAKAVQAVEDWINAYPREILGFRTADAVFADALPGMA
ncbi:MAG: IS30 family transposase [Oscillibacter sp.]|nr:IS30 family transposase [Oscillibacter sp.]MDD3347523.1 IS30 family transposase [Oscillibacter sp.]